MKKITIGCLGAVLCGAAALLAEGGLQYALDYLFNPWAHSLAGRSTLTGKWLGRVTSPTGQVRELFIDVHRSGSSNGDYSTCNTCPRIEGTAKLCGGGAPLRSYDVWGGPDDWSGSRFHLNYPRIIGQPLPGLQVGSIRGEWAGDALNLSMKFGFRNEKADVYASDNPDVNTASRFTMRRGDEQEYLRECKQLGSPDLP